MANSGDAGALEDRVGGFLRASFGEVRTDPDGNFVVRSEGVLTWIELARGPAEGAEVNVRSIAAVGTSVDDDLRRFLDEEGEGLSVGRFDLSEGRSPGSPIGMAQVQVVHTLPAASLTRKELADAVDAVATASARYGPIVTERAGGISGDVLLGTFGMGPELPAEPRQPAEAPPEPEREAGPEELLRRLRESPEPWIEIVNRPPREAPPVHRRPPSRRTEGIHVWMFVLGVAAGVAAGIVAYRRTSSWVLAGFALLVGMYFVGRGLPAVMTRGRKLQRFLYFALPPAAAVGVVALAHRAWSRWWLAVLAGTVAAVLMRIVTIALFHRVAVEEHDEGAGPSPGPRPG